MWLLFTGRVVSVCVDQGESVGFTMCVFRVFLLAVNSTFNSRGFV